MDDDRIAGSAREATETLRDGSQAVAKKVEEYPLGALLVGVGFALALLMAGTQDRRAPQHWRDYWDRDGVALSATRHPCGRSPAWS
jgi:hypothetical protein